MKNSCKSFMFLDSVLIVQFLLDPSGSLNWALSFMWLVLVTFWFLMAFHIPLAITFGDSCEWLGRHIFPTWYFPRSHGSFSQTMSSKMLGRTWTLTLSSKLLSLHAWYVPLTFVALNTANYLPPLSNCCSGRNKFDFCSQPNK